MTLLVVNAHSRTAQEVVRPLQQPIFYAGSTAILEVWFWDTPARLWFVMVVDAGIVAPHNAVGFHPQHTKQQVTQLREQWREHRRNGGYGPAGLAGD